MMRKAAWMAILVLGLLLAGVSTTTPRRLAISAQSFQRYFHDLKGAGHSVNPVARVVFSLVLASADPYQSEPE